MACWDTISLQVDQMLHETKDCCVNVLIFHIGVTQIFRFLISGAAPQVSREEFKAQLQSYRDPINRIRVNLA